MEAAGEVRAEGCIGYFTVLYNFLREHEISGDQGRTTMYCDQKVLPSIFFTSETGKATCQKQE